MEEVRIQPECEEPGGKEELASYATDSPVPERKVPQSRLPSEGRHETVTLDPRVSQ